MKGARVRCGHGSFRVLLLLATVWLANGHPQCLDYKPPFQPSGALVFCKEYSKFGCCDVERDIAISNRYYEIMDFFDYGGFVSCGKFIKSIMCQECSPYAAHLYDAEDANTPLRNLPGLCGDYCTDFWRRCRSTLSLLLTEDARVLEIEGDRDKFCALLELKDPEYCYPNVLTNAELNANLGTVQADPEGCLQLCLQEVANGLRNPVAMVHANDGTHRFFVAEQLGYVWVYMPNGSRVDKPFLNLTSAVLTSPWVGDERGFLCLAFHPKFKSTAKVYVYYSINVKKEERIRISEFTLSVTDMNMLDHNSERVLLEIVEPASNHNGGQLLFGYDGYLYIFVGDGGKAGDPFGAFGNSQNKSSLLGKVLRVDVDDNNDGPPYWIPVDNPFLQDVKARPEVYAYGVRNMWRCSFDRGDPGTGAGRGRLFCGDVGQNKFEEVDLIIKGGNYGWRAKEGFSCYDNKLCHNSSLNDILPIFAYPHKIGKSVTGGYVYRGCEMPNLNGLYIFGDFMSGRAPPGKCSFTAHPVPVKGKLYHFHPRERLVIKPKPSPVPVQPKTASSANTTKPKTTTKSTTTITAAATTTLRTVTTAIRSTTPTNARWATTTRGLTNYNTLRSTTLSPNARYGVTQTPVVYYTTPAKTPTTQKPRVTYVPSTHKPERFTHSTTYSTSKQQTSTGRSTKQAEVTQSHTEQVTRAHPSTASPTSRLTGTTGRPAATHKPYYTLPKTASKLNKGHSGKMDGLKDDSIGNRVNKKDPNSKPRKGRRRKLRQGMVRLASPGKRLDRGRVEIFIKGEWGTICDDLFDSKAATVVCRQLGYPFAIRVAKRAEMGQGNHLSILLDDVKCEGTERTLLDCQRSKIGQHNCSHKEDVGVICGYSEYDEEEG
ncbi:HIPL2 protein, partial [Polypterus senegalus]